METTGTVVPWRQRLTSSWCKASMFWQELQVVLCYRAFLPPCPSRKWELLSFFFPRSYLPFLAHKCLCHVCSLPSGAWWVRAGAIQHSYYTKKVCLSDTRFGSCQEEQPVHQTGAAGGIDVSHGWYIVCSPCSELLWASSSGEKKVRSISIHVLLPKYSLPPFGPIYRRRWWQHTVRFRGTQIILSKVFTVTWLFSTTAKWTPAFKNQPVAVF